MIYLTRYGDYFKNVRINPDNIEYIRNYEGSSVIYFKSGNSIAVEESTYHIDQKIREQKGG